MPKYLKAPLFVWPIYSIGLLGGIGQSWYNVIPSACPDLGFDATHMSWHRQPFKTHTPLLDLGRVESNQFSSGFLLI